MTKLLQLIAKLFGKNAISKTIGTRTNVIKLPGNEQKRLIKNELNIEMASDIAAQKLLKEAEDLIAEIPKMNDQEILTLTGNLQRLDNKLNPPSAEVLDITTKKPITGEGLEQLAARDGLPADVSPDSPIGKVMQGAQRLRKEKEELDRMLKDPVKQLEQEMQNPYRAGGALDPKMGIVRTAARQVLQKLAREGKINIEDPREAKAIIEGYQGGVDPIEVFRKTFGQEALGDLANLGDELLEIDNRGGSFKELKKILDDEGFFDLQQPKSPAQGMTDEELMKRIKDEDPEEFATGGRVGYSDGGYTFEQFLKDKQQVDEFMSIEELKREYKRMMELKKIRDQRDMVATGGRVGFDDGGILSLEEAKKLNPGMFVDTTTYNPIPENAPNMAAAEIAKVIMGTLGMDDDMTSRTFVFEEYVVPKRKDMMENYGLTLKEADNLIREEIEKFRTNKAVGGRVGFQKGTSKIFDQLEMDVPHPYGHRVNYQIGGDVAYDATNPIYGSSAITVTPDTIMGPKGNQIQAQTGVNPNLQRRKNPFENLGFLNISKHFDQNQLLKDAVKTGEITPKQYNELGGYDVTQTMGAGNPVMGGIGNLLGSTAYNVVQSLKGDQPFSDIPGDVFRNVKGGMGFISDDLKSKYENIINQSKNSITTPGTTQPSTATPFEKYKAKMLEGFRKNYAGQKTVTTDLQLDGTYSGTPKEIPIEDYFTALIAQMDRDPAAYGYASGGRVGYAYGSGLKLIKILQKAGKSLKDEIKKAVDDLIPSGDPKLDADMAVDNMLEDLNIDRDTLDQYDILDAYGMAYDELKKPLLQGLKNKPKPLTGKVSDDFDGDNASLIKELESVGLSKNAERLRLKQKYPGIDDDLLTRIIEDKDPQHKALVLAELDNAMELMKRDISSEEVVDILKQTSRTKNSKGGLNYLSGF